MPFKKYQRVQWSYGEPTYEGVVLRRYVRRDFIEVLVIRCNGKPLTNPYPVCMYPSETDLRAVEETA